MKGLSALERLFPGNSEMALRMRAYDWTTSSLGAPSAWPEPLLTAVRICLTSRFPIVMYWGRELTVLYNDPYIEFLGERKHPASLGRPGEEVWKELWPTIGPMLNGVLASGEATWSENLLMFFARRLPLEEVYVTFTFGPIWSGDASSVGGIFCACKLVTEQIVAERRLETLREIGARSFDVRDVPTASERSVAALASNPYDVPFAALYLVDEDASAARLASEVGFDGASALPRSIAFADASAPSPFAKVIRTREATQVTLQDLGAFARGPWSDPPAAALLLPLRVPGRDTPAGLLLGGISSRRVLDEEYDNFYRLLADQIARAIGNALGYEAERKRAEALAALDRAKTTFFSNVSHELRTPLTLIISPVEDLLARQDAEVSGSNRELLTIVRRNGQRLQKLVNTLLEFSRIEAGRVQARFERTDLAALTADLASNFRSTCERAGIRLTVDCPSLPAAAYVDRDMWERIVLNLVSNAFKFTLEGEIVVRLREADGHVELTVRDTGEGIPQAELPHLFERFRRIEQTRGRSQEGTGIGLALVFELVKLHGGAVHAESREGSGSAFTVTIPLGSEHIAPAQVVAERGTLAASSRAGAYVEEALSWLSGTESSLAGADQDGPAGPAVVRARLLIAEDNADMREYLRRLLGARYDVLLAADGELALEAARRELPDLVVSDVMMPRLDGFGLLRALRADERTRAIPFLMLSARAGEEARIDGLHAGADDYLVKPFSARELTARVDAMIELARVRRQAEQALRDSDRHKDEFLATLAHELRNPLAPVRMATEVLRRTTDENRTREAREVIDRQVANMARLIDDLMDLSRISRGKIKLQQESVELGDILRSAIETSRPLMDASGQKLLITLPDKSIPLHADATRVAQIFANLLNNASKYSERGKRIWLDADCTEREVVVRIRDEGAGIAPEMLSRIWDMFAQAEGMFERSRGGLGVGLTLARNLAQLHNGSIEASSEGLERGAEFAVRLPLAQPPAAESATPAATANDPELTSRPRVLVVDDNADAAQMLGTFLEMAGCEVQTAMDGKTALAVAMKFHPDVALLDLGMPPPNGFELARQIREASWGRNVLLVAITGWGHEELRQQSKEAGFDHHLVKPVAPQAVHRLLESAPSTVARRSASAS